MQKDQGKIEKYRHTKEHKDLSWETIMGEKAQQNFLDIGFDQVQCKTPRTILEAPLRL